MSSSSPAPAPSHSLSAPSSSSSSSSSSSDRSPSPISAHDDEDTRHKKSQYYFFKSTPPEEAQKYMPTLLTPGQQQQSAPVHIPSPSPSPSPEPSGSRWNAAGTWEEKDLSSWAHSRLKSLLSNLSVPVPSVNGYNISISANKVEGDATLIFSRGKKKAGYDLKITCDWTAAAVNTSSKTTESTLTVTGTIEIPSVDPTSCDDYELIVVVKERGKAADDVVDDLLRAVKKSKATLTKLIAEFEAELKEQ